MIKIFSEPPNWDKYSPESEATQAVTQYYDFSSELGSPDFFVINKKGTAVKTPTMDWINTQKHDGFYKIKNIERTHYGEYRTDLWILT